MRTHLSFFLPRKLVQYESELPNLQAELLERARISGGRSKFEARQQHSGPNVMNLYVSIMQSIYLCTRMA